MMASESPVRNPSPPPPLDKEEEDVLKGDVIPGTAYSKQWLFSTLLKLLRKVEGLQLDASTTSEQTDEGSETDAGTPTEEDAKTASAVATDDQTGAGDPDDQAIPNGAAPASASQSSPLTDQKLDEIIPPGYEIVEPPSTSRPGDKIDEETEGELCQVSEISNDAVLPHNT